MDQKDPFLLDQYHVTSLSLIVLALGGGKINQIKRARQTLKQILGRLLSDLFLLKRTVNT